MSECIFCMVANREIPSKVVFEDEMVLAFDDIAPQGPVHTLIIPKDHYADLGDGVPTELFGRLMDTVVRVAEIKGIDTSGYRVIINSGRDASQTVNHLHVHVIGGRQMSHGMVNFAENS
ncbi:MAG: histidine triad nucleotide-binding protein [Coriobacteriia bacterium]|nr:histidine triad nucleotide-binding protein [Coriobacteriia bacterium]